MNKEIFSSHEDDGNYNELEHEYRFKRLLYQVVSDQIVNCGAEGMYYARYAFEMASTYVFHGKDKDLAFLDIASRCEDLPSDIENDPSFQVYFEVALDYLSGKFDD